MGLLCIIAYIIRKDKERKKEKSLNAHFYVAHPFASGTLPLLNKNGTIERMCRYAPFLFCAALLLGGCHKKARVPAPPPAPNSRPPAAAAVPAPPVGSTERGVASWYGKPYDGRAAADGEIYDMEQLVAAHRTLPFQTMVRVRNLTNNKTVDVRIIDRGPFVAGRIIDLSHAAARAIELIGPGFGPVELTILSSPAATAPAQFG